MKEYVILLNAIALTIITFIFHNIKLLFLNSRKKTSKIKINLNHKNVRFFQSSEPFGGTIII